MCRTFASKLAPTRASFTQPDQRIHRHGTVGTDQQRIHVQLQQAPDVLTGVVGNRANGGHQRVQIRRGAPAEADEQRRTAQLSLRQLADAAGVSNPYLSQIERGLRKPSAEVLQQVAKALRISAETLYVRAGILDAERDRDEVETRAVILADPTLNERQKQVLLQIYESFRKENGFGAGAGSEEGGGATDARDNAQDSDTQDSDTQDRDTQGSDAQDSDTQDSDAPGRETRDSDSGPQQTAG